MVMEGQIEVALQLEGASWDYAAFAAIICAAGGRFSYLDYWRFGFQRGVTVASRSQLGLPA